jgi:lysozyme
MGVSLTSVCSTSKKLLLKITQFKALMSLTIKKISTGKISPQKFQFVYLKATEGGDYKDPKFQENWLKAREHGFHVGAYHFYRLCRDGKTQAENFIATVLNKADALPPVIDLNMTTTVLILIPKNNYLKK